MSKKTEGKMLVVKQAIEEITAEIETLKEKAASADSTWDDIFDSLNRIGNEAQQVNLIIHYLKQ